ncbi:hypothetical protein [Alienimonas californiensis]|uniref:Uncharacterized protein n=1 Tax=Alienimonas californiensis TaxID=2527989 RepID=A0A517P3P2_9PLAN|nr:hypothetical protein [Alienimonas californiensis]QDT13988.1 hypothetical protein CA12_00560 [Alienimonas californiensis]
MTDRAASPLAGASSVEELDRRWERERHRLSLPGKAPGSRYEPTYARAAFMSGTGYLAAWVLRTVLSEEPAARTALPAFVAAVATAGGLWLFWKTWRFNRARAAYRARREELR